MLGSFAGDYTYAKITGHKAWMQYDLEEPIRLRQCAESYEASVVDGDNEFLDLNTDSAGKGTPQFYRGRDIILYDPALTGSSSIQNLVRVSRPTYTESAFSKQRAR